MNCYDYHESTKHSYYSVRSTPNQMDWNNQPLVFKNYPDTYEKIDLDNKKENHKFIELIGALSAKKTYPNVEYYLRINPSAGALYPNEVYFQSRGNEDFEDGIYHYEPLYNQVCLLKNIEDEGIEKYFEDKKRKDGFIFLISAIYYRSSWKYKNRAFRYCLLDAGHLLGTLEASCYMYDKDYSIEYDFNKKALNESFGFLNKEFFLSSFFATNMSDIKIENKDDKQKEVKEFNMLLPYCEGTNTFEENPIIEQAYSNSLVYESKKEQKLKPIFNYNKEYLYDVILKRRSIRELYNQTIKKEEFLRIYEILKEPITSFEDEDIDIYCVINNVKQMKLGLFKDGVYLKEGDFKNKAGYLCLEQQLAQSAAVTFFLTSKSKNYQSMYQKAGIIGHRMYLCANYLNIGCSGIGAYYDDEVCFFIEDNTKVLYALAIGS